MEGDAVLGGAPPNGEEVFDRWCRSGGEHGALGEVAVRKYRSIWNAWLRHLAGQDLRWPRARARDVEAFLNGIGRRREGRAGLASPVSRRRYWTVLSRVYEFARSQSLCRGNPARKAADVPRTELSAAVVLPPAYLDVLRGWALKGGAPSTADARDGQDGWVVLRNRALLALVLDGALTTGELANLRRRQVLAVSGRMQEVVRLEGARRAQRRDVALGAATSRLLRQWMRRRAELLDGDSDGPLFLSVKGRGALTPKTVFIALQSFLRDLEGSVGTRLAQNGANLLRSSMIAQWLREGMSASDVLGRAGLENLQALRRLEHAAPRRQRPQGEGG